MDLNRRTRILATLGPSSDAPETIEALLEAGADAFRLNFSHGTHEEHAERCRRIRAAAARVGREVAIVQDLGGPKIRIGPMPSPVTLAEGAGLAIEHGRFDGGAGRVSCSFDALFTSVRDGDRLLIDDGRIEVVVKSVESGRLDTEVLTGGVLSAHKGINVPNVALRTSAVTEKDLLDLRAGIEIVVDVIGLSFVQSAADVVAARRAAAEAGAPDLPIIAKIEKPNAVTELEEILRVADGLMVARGDLGIEVPLETVPAIQRQIITAARRRGVPVILATQVLESMRTETRPTRAEVTDAAHAVDEGVDAIMLAGETASGRYPVRAVATLDTIIRAAERARSDGHLPDGPTSDPVQTLAHRGALCEAAVALASRAGAAAIVGLTGAGRTAILLASLRPDALIFAATSSAQTAARLNLVWGVTPILTADTSLPVVRDAIIARRLLPRGAVIAIVSITQTLGHGSGNFVNIERL
jgi:pyruvate kinase